MIVPLLNYGSRLVSQTCSGSIVPSILNLCFRLEGVVNVILRSSYPLRKIPYIQWTWGHVGSRGSTNIVKKSETTSPAWNRFPNIHPAIALPSHNPYWVTFTLWKLMLFCGIINNHGALSQLKLCTRAHWVISVGINFFFSLEFIFDRISNHKAFKEMGDKKDRGADDVPGDVLKRIGEDGLGLMTRLINNIYETGE